MKERTNAPFIVVEPADDTLKRLTGLFSFDPLGSKNVHGRDPPAEACIAGPRPKAGGR
jgi:hypothetical protein